MRQKLADAWCVPAWVNMTMRCNTRTRTSRNREIQWKAVRILRSVMINSYVDVCAVCESQANAI